MALCPFARHRLIPPGANDPRITPIGAILHVDAGNLPTLYHYFSGPSGGIESHFHIQRDGGIEQYRDTAYEADANHNANSFFRDGRRVGFVSIETQGYEFDHWTDAQLDSIKRLLSWLSQEHDFPLRRCPGWDKPGVGYHVMFGAPGPWTPVAKSCPGPRRIEQFNDVLVPWMRNGGDDMPYRDWPKADRDALTKDVARAVWFYINGHTGRTYGWIIRRIWQVGGEKITSLVSGNKITPHTSQRHAQGKATNAQNEARAANAKLDIIVEAVSQLEGIDGDALAAKVAAAVERLDAEAVADKLEVVVAADDDESGDE